MTIADPVAGLAQPMLQVSSGSFTARIRKLGAFPEFYYYFIPEEIRLIQEQTLLIQGGPNNLIAHLFINRQALAGEQGFING